MSKIVFLKSLQTLLTPLKRLIDRKAENVNWNENDSSASGYIANRPFYTSEKKEKVVAVPETEFYFEDYYSWGYSDFMPKKGEVYNIKFDGKDYECAVKTNSEYADISLGNLSFYEDVQNTEEPFALYFYEVDGMIIFEVYILAETATCTLEISHNETIEKIVKVPEKYLPEGAVVGIKGTGKNAEVFNNGNPEQANGEYAHAEGFETYAEEYAHAEGYMTHAVHTSHAEGRETVTNSSYAHAEGYQTQAQSLSSHAEGSNTTASGEGSHAEGMHTITSSQAAHAEGFGTKASGASSHAEGSSTKAYGNRSHAEGEYTQAGAYENNGTEKGKGSHAEGYYTKAFSDYQHVQGKFNISDIKGKYAHIVGNGESDSSRSNAHTLDWDGNGWFAGIIEGTALILKSTDGTKRFKVTVDNSGTLTATEIA